MIRKFDTARTVTAVYSGGVAYVFDLVVVLEERKDGSFLLIRTDGTENIINNSYEYLEIGGP